MELWEVQMNNKQKRTYEILNELKESIINSSLMLSDAHRDGRINSAHDEDIIVDWLRNAGFGKKVFLTSDDLNISNRCWWDIWIVETDTPVNIKSATHKTADNACNFLSLLWALTDVEVQRARCPNAGKDTMQYIDMMNSIVDENSSRDYWFFSVNKNDTSDVIITSIRNLNHATTNCNNLPFQINWKKNQELKLRTVPEARTFYNDILRETFEKDWRMNLYEAL
jgi:hypothetical protein